jgi:hypothetical protein
MWFNNTRNDEHSNYAIATAGYVGNNLSSGIEAIWKYVKLDTVGTACSNQRISARVCADFDSVHICPKKRKNATKLERYARSQVRSV